MQLTRPHPNLGEAEYLLCGLGGAAILGAIALSKNVDLLAIARSSTIGFALGWVTASDLRERRIPNRITIPAAGICLALWLTDAAHPRDLVTGVVVGLLALGIGLCCPSVFGMGDVKLVLLILVGLGASAVPALGLGLVIAALAALTAVVVGGRDRLKAALPFAPFLALAACLAVAW